MRFKQSFKGEGSSEPGHNTEESWGHHVQWHKPGTEGQALPDSTETRRWEEDREQDGRTETHGVWGRAGGCPSAVWTAGEGRATAQCVVGLPGPQAPLCSRGSRKPVHFCE